MNKCKYAGDPNDSTCLNCNGETYEISGTKYTSLECAGFEPAEDDTPPFDTSEELNKMAEKLSTPVTPVDAPTTSEEEIKVNTQTEPEKPVTEQANSSEIYVSKAHVTKLCYSSGITVEVKGKYYKFNVMEEWEIPEGADVEKEREALWNKLNDEVDNQVDGVKNL